MDCFFDAQEGSISNVDKDYLDNMIPDISKRLEQGSFGCPFLNCWVMSDVELFLMWYAYSSINEGIAIKTTIGNIIDSFDPNDKREIYISDVKYIDHNTESTFVKSCGYTNFLAPSFCKEKGYQQEQELRLVYLNQDILYTDDIKREYFDVSLDKLINEIWIAPKATDWFEKVVQAEMHLHNIYKPLKRSQIKTKY